MAGTPKRAGPTKRGCFDLGEKEIISAVLEATNETAGFTITFPPEGGRGTTPNRRRFRPTECGLSINSRDVPTRASLAAPCANLRTLIQHGPGLPMSESRRMVTVDILKKPTATPPPGSTRWAYPSSTPSSPSTSTVKGGRKL